MTRWFVIAKQVRLATAHDHGTQYRAKIVDLATGQTKYLLWCDSKYEFDLMMRGLKREPDKQYLCQERRVTCPACEDSLEEEEYEI